LAAAPVLGLMGAAVGFAGLGAVSVARRTVSGMPSNHLELAVPLVTTRAELAAAFGKEDASERASQPGIVTMREPHKKLFVFSDPHKSKENGYNFDGWTEGDEQGPVFDYTGTGPNGHQVLSKLNGTLLNHQE
jgi:hypothetical protein